MASDLGLKSEYGPKPDYGLKRRHAAIRFFAIVGLLALVAVVTGLWLFGQFLALASLPAILILAALALAAILSVAKQAKVRSLAITPLAFAIGLAPHAIFLIVYNLAVNLGGHDAADILPTLGGLADTYEGGVLRLHQRAEIWFLGGGGLVIFTVASCALVAGLIFWSRLCARLARPARVGVVLVQAVLLGAVATTVFSFIPAGHWTPNYAERLATDLAFLDQTRANDLLAEKLTAAARQNAPALRQVYGPAIRAAVQDLRQPVDASATAAAHQLALDYLSAAVDAGAMSGIDNIDPGRPPDQPAMFADRPTVLALEGRIAVDKAKLAAARSNLAVALADAIGGAGSPTEGPVINAFAAGLADNAVDRMGARFDSSFGQGLADRLGQLDAAPGHPLTQALAQFLETAPHAGWQSDSAGSVAQSPAPADNQPAASGLDSARQ